MNLEQRQQEREQIAKELADLLEQKLAGRGDLGEILELLKWEIWRRDERRKASDWSDELIAFKAQHGAIDWPEYAAKYGFTYAKEEYAAYDILETVRFNRNIRFFVDTEPTPAQRESIANMTTMSAKQAAEYLGISRYQFDKLREKHNLEHASLWQGGPRNSYPRTAKLYRKSDVDRLKG